jgi:hypothetical protein
VEIGALGMPMVFDNIILDRDLDQAHSQASFVDPYIGRDAGYLQVTRLNGAGPALVVMPDKGTPLEAYKPLMQEGRHNGEDIFTEKSPRTQVSEGFYDWTVASKGFAEKEWAKAGEQWNTPPASRSAPARAAASACASPSRPPSARSRTRWRRMAARWPWASPAMSCPPTRPPACS